MAVLSFQSADGKVAIKASTAADTANCWRRFSARVGENASRYCSYRSSLAGRLAIALPSQSHSLTDAGEEASTQWNDLPPVFYETAVYNVNIYLSDIESEPRVVHKLKEVSDLSQQSAWATTSGCSPRRCRFSTSPASLSSHSNTSPWAWRSAPTHSRFAWFHPN